MIIKEEYKKAYEFKKMPEGIFVMNQFCENAENSVDIDDIPAILNLYYDYASTHEQNEFVTEILNKVVEKNPQKAAKKILENIMILKKEQAEECLGEIFLIFCYWNPQFKKFLLNELKRVEPNVQRYMIESIENLAEEEEDQIYSDFVVEYNEKL